MKSNLMIHEETAGLIEAARSVERAKGDIFGALSVIYGESQAETIYNDFAQLFEPITAKLGKYVIIQEVETFEELATSED